MSGATVSVPGAVLGAAVPTRSADAPAHPIERLMRDRAGLIDDIVAGREVAAIARAMLITAAVGGALFGAAIGLYRGGIQIGYAAVKLPLVLVLTAALAAPALTAFNVALDRPARLTRDLALALTALALGALALTAQAPLILLARAVDVDYHHTALLVVACCALSGVVSLAVLVRGLRAPGPRGALIVATLLCAVTVVVGGQLAWTLRPYLLRPSATTVPFLRAIEGNLIQAVVETAATSGALPRDEEVVP